MKAVIYCNEGNILTTLENLENPVIEGKTIRHKSGVISGISENIVILDDNQELDYPYMLDNAKKLKMEELNLKCNETIVGRFLSTVDGVQYYFSCDDEAQKNFDKAKLSFMDATITDIKWTAYDLDGNVCRLMLNDTKFKPVYVDHLMQINGNISKLRDTLEPQVYAALTIEEVNGIVW